MCYVPTLGTPRNYTITGYFTKYTRYHVGLLRYIQYHEVVQRYIRYKRCETHPHTVQRVITPLSTARRGITSDYSGTYDTNGVLLTDTQYNAKLHHYALHGGVLHKVHAVPRRTTQEYNGLDYDVVPRYIR